MTVARALAALSCAACLVASAHSAPVNWVLADEYPLTSLPGEGDLFFAAAVEQRAGGNLVVTPQPDAKSGFKSREQLRAVAEGKIAMANNFAGALGDENPFFLLSSLPFLAADAAQARRLYDIAKPHYEALLERYNQRLLFATPWPASGIWARSVVDTPEAVARLRIRTYDRTGTELMAALGAAASVVSFTDLPAKVRAGEIDAALSSGDGGAGRKLWELLPAFTEINYAMPLSLATVNLDAWNALDAATQRAVIDAAAATEERQWQALGGRVAQNYERMRANGMSIAQTVTPALSASFRKSARAVIDEWETRSGAEGREVLAEFRKVTAR
jgi:TRAP-type C4-dicarboxylate transport system substrate-binding protein